MDYIKETYGRMELRQLRSFLLYGTDEYDENVQPYMETLQKCGDPIQRRLEALCPDSTELDHATADLNDALTAYQNVFMELGMKVGARLLHQLLLVGEQSASGGDTIG